MVRPEPTARIAALSDLYASSMIVDQPSIEANRLTPPSPVQTSGGRLGQFRADRLGEVGGILRVGFFDFVQPVVAPPECEDRVPDLFELVGEGR